jgi:hypothetical protein
MDPAWADYIDEDHKSEQRVNKARREGRLYVEASPPSVH